MSSASFRPEDVHLLFESQEPAEAARLITTITEIRESGTFRLEGEGHAMDLVTFLAARLDETQAGAWSVHDVAQCDALLYEENMADAARRDPDCNCGYPARVLREIEAGRALLRRYQDAQGAQFPDFDGGYASALEDELQNRAAVYSDHPEWKP